MAEEYIYATDKSIFLDNLKIKLCQVKAKNSSFCPNQTFFELNVIHNKVFELIYINIKKFGKKFTHYPDHKKKI